MLRICINLRKVGIIYIQYKEKMLPRGFFDNEERIIMQVGVWVGIFISAVVAFLVGDLYGQPLHWYLFVIILCVGVFINTIILIIKTHEDKM